MFYGDHKHTVVGSQHLIVNVHAYHSIGAHFRRPLFHLGHCLPASAYKLLLVGRGASAEEIGQSGHEILGKIHACDDLAEYNALIFRNAASLHRGSRSNNHSVLLVPESYCFTLSSLKTALALAARPARP